VSSGGSEESACRAFEDGQRNLKECALNGREIERQKFIVRRILVILYSDRSAWRARTVISAVFCNDLLR
jgi:hypothetical protein